MAVELFATLLACAIQLSALASLMFFCSTRTTRRAQSPPHVTSPPLSPSPAPSTSPVVSEGSSVPTKHTGYDSFQPIGDLPKDDVDGRKESKEGINNASGSCDKCGRKWVDDIKGKDEKGEEKEMSPKKKDDEKKEEEDKKKEEMKEDEKKEEKEDERKEENKEEEKNDSNKDKVKSPAKSRDVAVAPNALSFPEKGSLKQLIIMNTTDQRLAVKVKCSDNQLYRVAPVFGFCPQKGTLKVDVLRREGPPKLDKLVVATIECKDDCNEAAPLFKAKDTAEQTTNVALNVALSSTKI